MKKKAKKRSLRDAIALGTKAVAAEKRRTASIGIKLTNPTGALASNFHPMPKRSRNEK